MMIKKLKKKKPKKRLKKRLKKRPKRRKARKRTGPFHRMSKKCNTKKNKNLSSNIQEALSSIPQSKTCTSGPRRLALCTLGRNSRIGPTTLTIN